MDSINNHTYQVHESSAFTAPNTVPTFGTSAGKSFNVLYCLTSKIFGDLGEIHALLLNGDIKDATLLYNVLFNNTSNPVKTGGQDISEWEEDMLVAQSGIVGLTTQATASPVTDQFLIDNPKLYHAIIGGIVSKNFDDFKDDISSKISKLQDDFASGTYPEVIEDIEALISQPNLSKQTTADSPFWIFRNSLADFLSPAYQSSLPPLPSLCTMSKDPAESAAEMLSVILAKEDFDIEFMNLANSTGFTNDANAIFDHEFDYNGQNTFKLVGENYLEDELDDLYTAGGNDDPYFITHLSMYRDLYLRSGIVKCFNHDMADIDRINVLDPYGTSTATDLQDGQHDFYTSLVDFLKEMHSPKNE